MKINHLQKDKPIKSFTQWKLEVFKLFADAWAIDQIAASKRIKDSSLKEWYNDGFTPYVFFRENYQPLI